MVPTRQNFPGGAFKGAEENAVATIGTINVSAYALQFESDAFTLSFPTQHLQIDLDESGERIVMTHPNYPDWTLYTLDLEIVDHPALQRFGLKHTLADLRDQTAGPSRHAKMVYGILGVLAALFLSLWIFGNQIVGTIAESLPREWETKIGQAAFKDLKQEFKITNDAPLTNRVRLVAQRLKKGLPHSAPNFTFHVADTPISNALALPDGTIVVMRGLLEDSTPEELAGVLAHELAHVIEKHSMRQLAQRIGPTFIAQYLFGGDGALAMLTAGATYLGSLEYSRENEREADDKAWDILVAANIDPRGLADYFRKLRRGEGRRSAPDIFSTHPATTERIKYLDDRWAKAAKKSGFERIDAGPELEKTARTIF